MFFPLSLSLSQSPLKQHMHEKKNEILASVIDFRPEPILSEPLKILHIKKIITSLHTSLHLYLAAILQDNGFGLQKACQLHLVVSLQFNVTAFKFVPGSGIITVICYVLIHTPAQKSQEFHLHRNHFVIYLQYEDGISTTLQQDPKIQPPTDE